MVCPLFHLVAEALKALADMDNPRFLRMQPHAPFLLEKSLGGGQCSLGFCSCTTQHDKVVGPARQTKARHGHLTVEWREEDIRPQGTGDAALGHPRQRWLPIPIFARACPQDIAHQCEVLCPATQLNSGIDSPPRGKLVSALTSRRSSRR